jgi:uncharacterized RDD family membrane protein YckC
MEPQQPPEQPTTPPAPAPAQQQPPAPAPTAATPPPASWAAPEVDAGPAPGVKFGGYAGRLVAYIIDGFVLSVVWIALAALGIAFLGASIEDGQVTGSGAGAFTALMVVGTLVSFLYFPFFWARGGQTPGMRVFRLRVVRDADGGPIGWGPAILRLIGFWVSSAVFYLGFIWIFIDKRRRGWHDLIAGTVVIEQ